MPNNKYIKFDIGDLIYCPENDDAGLIVALKKVIPYYDVDYYHTRPDFSVTENPQNAMEKKCFNSKIPTILISIAFSNKKIDIMKTLLCMKININKWKLIKKK